MRANQTRNRLVFAALAVGALLLSGQPCQAVWHTALSEHFRDNPQTWPWGNWTLNPARNWYQSGPPYVWGVQDEIYKVTGLDVQSLWCCGLPPELSPTQDNYPPSMNAWAKWGPINLGNAVAGRATFAYYCITEAVQDYVRWGASPSNSWGMYEAGRRSGLGSPSWSSFTVDFDSLQYAGGDTSLLGDNSVWLVFQFVSDADDQRYIGAFIDELSIAWDDGTFDLFAEMAELANPDSTPLSIAFIGDTICFSLIWSAEGSGTTPDFDITCLLDDSLIYTERRNAEIGDEEMLGFTTYTTPWVVTPDSHTVIWTVDARNEVVEANEANNDTLLGFISEMPNDPPWIEITRPIWGDTAAASFVIHWVDADSNDNALITLYWNFDTLSTNGVMIPGAVAMDEDDEADSFVWNISSVPEGPIWVLAMIEDGTEPFFDYSAGPLIVDHDWLNAPGYSASILPQKYELPGVYPNPFNQSSAIRVALPVTQTVTIRVLDVTGRVRDEIYRGPLEAGYHELLWTARDLPSGMYIVEMITPLTTLRTKAVLLK